MDTVRSFLKTAGLTSIVVLILVFVFAATSQADSRRGRGDGSQDNVSVGQRISDGKGGRTSNSWRYDVGSRQVNSVQVTLRRERGGNNTFVNLRYGSGSTFENGKREYLRDNSTHTLSWNVNAPSNGQPLVLNAYEGEVFVENVQINYQASQAAPPALSGDPKPHHENHHSDNDYDDGGSSYDDDRDQSATNDPETDRRCRRMYNMRPPRIELGQLRSSGGLFSGKYKAQGSVSGVCISEAGYYENGRLKEKIDFPYDDRFQRREFSFTVRSGRRGELRAYNSAGDEDNLSVDDQIQDDSGSQGSGGNLFNF